MKTESIEFYDDALKLNGFVATPDDVREKRPGILVVHEAWGLTKHTMDRAKMLAGLGYVALAADMFGEGRVVADIQTAAALVEDLRGDPKKFRRRAGAAVSALQRLPQVDSSRLAGIGFCFGGSAVLELAREGSSLCGVVSFHGGLTTLASAEKGVVKTRVLVCTGADDPYAPREHIDAFEDEMTKAGVDWQLISYGGTPHSFTNPEADGSVHPAIRYHELADKRSWSAMRSFLEEVFVR